MEADVIPNNNVARLHWLCWLSLVKLEHTLSQTIKETKEEHSVIRSKNGMAVEYPSLADGRAHTHTAKKYIVKYIFKYISKYEKKIA